ncbi:MAG: helix-turn-helix domain-containing protein [Mariniphaga sp.]
METEGLYLIPKQVVDTIQQIGKDIQQINEKLNGKNTAEKLYYIAQVAKMLGKSPQTVKKMVQSGVIRSTANGMITESAIEDFLKGV